MSENMFAPKHSVQVDGSEAPSARRKKAVKLSSLPDYDKPPRDLGFDVVSFLIGAAVGFLVFFVYYKLVPLSVVGGVAAGIANIFLRRNSAREKRKLKLRAQFLDMLEAMSVSLRAGNPLAKALVSAREDLVLSYSPDSDIVVELDAIISKFSNAIPLSEAFMDFAQRSGLEDVASFASVYATIEGKSSRADEIVRDTQRIIADKMTIEMEIQTMMTSAKTEVNIMQVMPLVILLIMGYAGAGFMNAIYEPGVGQVVATVSLGIFVVSYLMARKLCKVQL